MAILKKIKKTTKKPVMNGWVICTKQNDVNNKQLWKVKSLNLVEIF